MIRFDGNDGDGFIFFFFFNFEELNLEAYTGCFEIC